MRIDPADVFGHTLASVPWRLFVSFCCICAGMLSRFAFDLIEFQYYRVLESVLFFPFTLSDAAISAGWWAVVAVPALVTSIWIAIVFAYDGRGGGFSLFKLYAFSYLIVMFHGHTAPISAVILGVALTIAFLVTVLIRRREAS